MHSCVIINLLELIPCGDDDNESSITAAMRLLLTMVIHSWLPYEKIVPSKTSPSCNSPTNSSDSGLTSSFYSLLRASTAEA